MVWGILCCVLAVQTTCIVKKQESICSKLSLHWNIHLLCYLVLFSCNVAGLIIKSVCGKILVTALIKGRDRCRLLIITAFYIAADFSDECTGHTWSNSVAQGGVSRSLANLPALAELWLWSFHHLFTRLHSSTDGKRSSATDSKWWVKIKACVFELQLLRFLYSSGSFFFHCKRLAVVLSLLPLCAHIYSMYWAILFRSKAQWNKKPYSIQ